MRRHEHNHVSTSEASDPASASSGSDDLAPLPALKKRRSTYYVRKEAIDMLHSQVEKLQEELSRVQEHSQATPYLVTRQHNNHISWNHQLFAGLASMLSSYKQTTRSFVTTPLTTVIHLPMHQHDRDHTLRSLHKPKVDAALRFMVERTRFVDLQLKHFHEELVHEPKGDAVSVRLDITSFERRFSLRQVFEALKFYIVNQEKIVTEVTGDSTEYSDAYDHDFQFGQVKLTSTISSGDVAVEANSVTFLSFVEEPTVGVPVGGHAIVASDFVNLDDRDVRRSSETQVVREELTLAVLVTETMTPTGAVVTLSKWQHSRFHAPTSQALTRLQIEELHAMGKRRWETMLRVIHERLEALW